MLMISILSKSGRCTDESELAVAMNITLERS